MRYLGLPLAVTACLTVAAPARADDLPDYDAIRTPDSPAFTLLGASPKQIDRPNTPKQVAVSLGGFVTGGGAIEIAPYWLWSHPDLTLDDYKTGASQLARNVSVSLGTRALEANADLGTAASTSVAVGVRTSAMLIARDDGCADKIAAAREDAAFAARTMAMSSSLPHRVEYQAAMNAPDPASALAQLKIKIVDEAKVSAANDEATECVRSGEPDARGLAVEVAAATSVDFADNELAGAAMSTSAVWGAAAYKWIGGSLVALTRLRRDRVTGGQQYVLVPGGRALYAHGRVAISLEAILQKQLARSEGVAKLDVTYRVTAGLDVRVADATWLTLSFGKDFGHDSTGKLFSLANLSWGFGDPVINAE